jgi:hypothetical protein
VLFPRFEELIIKIKNKTVSNFNLILKRLVSDEDDSCDCGTEFTGRFKRVGTGKRHFQPSKTLLLS